MLRYIKKNFRKRVNPVKKLLGIADTTITKITKSKMLPSILSKPMEKINSYKDTVLHGRNDYPPKARDIIKKYGEKKIIKMDIVRQPIQSFINTTFNALTFGQFQKKLESLEYDKLFHLRMIITLDDNVQIQIEKNEVINITTKIDKVKGQEIINVPIGSSLTLNELLKNGQNVLKDKWFSYRAFGNNCQDFQIALLQGSNLLNDQLKNFIKQDVEELSTINPYLKKIANTLTDLGGKFNEIIEGTGINQKHSKNYKIQSVVFNKKYWTIPKAKKWLKENNYKCDDVDKKDNSIRFRQIDPATINKKTWKYTTHRLENNIDLIILYKKMSHKNENMNKISGTGRPRKSEEQKKLEQKEKERKLLEKQKKKEKSAKLYYGIGEVPKGYRQASMEEAMRNGKINYWGLKKVDNKVLSITKEEPTQKRLTDLMIKMAGLKGKMTKTQRELEYNKSKNLATKELMTTLEETKKELIRLNTMYQELMKKKMKGGELVHIDLNSHNSYGKSKNNMEGEGINKKINLDEMDEIKGGMLELDLPRQSNTSSTPVPSFKKQGHKIKSKNVLLNNLTTEDISDLKKLFSEVNEEDMKKKAITKRVRKATIKRVKKEVKKVKKDKSNKSNIRGTLEGKREALKKYKKRTI
jgi:hypothetical protein